MQFAHQPRGTKGPGVSQLLRLYTPCNFLLCPYNTKPFFVVTKCDEVGFVCCIIMYKLLSNIAGLWALMGEGSFIMGYVLDKFQVIFSDCRGSAKK